MNGLIILLLFMNETFLGFYDIARSMRNLRYLEYDFFEGYETQTLPPPPPSSPLKKGLKITSDFLREGKSTFSPWSTLSWNGNVSNMPVCLACRLTTVIKMLINKAQITTLMPVS